MKPKFKDQLTWQQTELLIQPALIRVIDNLRKQLEESPWQGTYQEIKSPYPGYQLYLTRDNLSFTLDIWELCFQVCFLDYDSQLENPAVEIDSSLLDETGDIDWQSLERKTQQIITEIFANLPQN